MEWQLIETLTEADGTVLAYCNASCGEISGVYEQQFMDIIRGGPDDRADPLRMGIPGPWFSGDGDYYATWIRPTHWMPLPPAPTPIGEP